MARLVHLVLLLLPAARLCMRSDGPSQGEFISHEDAEIVREKEDDEDVKTITMTKQEQPVVLVTVNVEYLPMFKNWLFFALPHLQGRPLVVVAEDESSVEPMKALFQKLSNKANITLVASASDSTGNPAMYGSKAYGELVGRRAGHILNLLEKNVPVLYVDIDTVWLEDPFKDIHAAGSADLYLTIDHPNEERPFCTCFILANPTESSRLAIKKWGEKVVGHASNQGVFNDELSKLQASSKVVVKTLPEHRYPHGNQGRSAYAHGPAVLHANWMKGLANKTEFLEKFGVWKPQAIDEPESELDEPGRSTKLGWLQGTSGFSG